MYSVVKPLLFKLDPEKAHDISLSSLAKASKMPFAIEQIQRLYGSKVPDLPVRCMGIDFKNPVGLAAGLDKDARAFPAFSAFGFSAVEMGTVTPKPQPGNPKPRMFRLEADQAIINRMGFNSGGMESFLSNFTRTKNTSIAGINIGKNAVTPIEGAHFDYVSALNSVYHNADYVTVNISSPNTKSLRELQSQTYLDELLAKIKTAQQRCESVHKRYVPIALKVAPDLESDEIEAIAELLISHQFDALIATNTTIDRPASLRSEYASEAGGLSGAPVRDRSTQCIKEFYKFLQGQVQIIGVGGISNAEDAWQKMLAGADYVQIYSHFIYQGPQMIQEIVEGLQAKMKSHGFDDLGTAMLSLRSN